MLMLRYCLFSQLMLDSWNTSIFSTIKNRLQDASMKLVQAERNGEAFDSQLVIGVRESYGIQPERSFPSIFYWIIPDFMEVIVGFSELVLEHRRQASNLPG